MILRLPKCDFCENRLDQQGSACLAFPDGIPYGNITDNEADECSNGIKYVGPPLQYEPKEGSVLKQILDTQKRANQWILDTQKCANHKD